MPLNKKGQEIKKAIEKEYGAEKGKKVFYASENKGNIKGVKKAKSKAIHKKLEEKNEKHKGREEEEEEKE